MQTLDRMEQEREKLHHLVEKGASKQEVQKQSEVLDQCIVKFYLIQRGAKQ